jgi:tRNA 2-thiouridine synthesizing protein B
MLHIIDQSPWGAANVTRCLAVCSAQDKILLIENGVFCGLSGTPSAQQLTLWCETKQVFLLLPHAVERGIASRLLPNLVCIDFAGWVGLVELHYPIMRW